LKTININIIIDGDGDSKGYTMRNCYSRPEPKNIYTVIIISSSNSSNIDGENGDGDTDGSEWC